MDEMKKKLKKSIFIHLMEFLDAEGMFLQIVIKICFTIYCLPCKMFCLQINECTYTPNMKVYF